MSNQDSAMDRQHNRRILGESYLIETYDLGSGLQGNVYLEQRFFDEVRPIPRALIALREREGRGIDDLKEEVLKAGTYYMAEVVQLNDQNQIVRAHGTGDLYLSVQEARENIALLLQRAQIGELPHASLRSFSSDS